MSTDAAMRDLAPADTLPIKHVARLSQMSAIAEPRVEAVMWTRHVPTAVRFWLEATPGHRLPEGRFVLDPYDVSTCLNEMFADAGHSGHPAVDWLADDAAQLARFISAAMSVPKVRLRLEAVSDNACSRFHIDNVISRLICTYRGPGTEIGCSTTSDEPEKIDAVPTGTPALFKGQQWPGADNLSLKHRSPPIAGSGQTRLVLVLEAVSSKAAISPYDETI